MKNQHFIHRVFIPPCNTRVFSIVWWTLCTVYGCRIFLYIPQDELRTSSSKHERVSVVQQEESRAGSLSSAWGWEGAQTGPESGALWDEWNKRFCTHENVPLLLPCPLHARARLPLLSQLPWPELRAGISFVFKVCSSPCPINPPFAHRAVLGVPLLDFPREQQSSQSPLYTGQKWDDVCLVLNYRYCFPRHLLKLNSN